MTYVSYFLMLLSAVFGMTAVAMYFVFDIKQCWKIVRGRCSLDRKYAVSGQDKKSRRLAASEPTELFTPEKTVPLPACESTVLLESKETVPLPTMSLVQDIVMGDMGEGALLDAQ